jgi:hypothetical protein
MRIRLLSLTGDLTGLRTEIDRELVSPLHHDVLVVSAVQFGERGQARGAHPILEMFVALEIGKIGRIVAVRVAQSPVRRRHYVAKVVFRR